MRRGKQGLREQREIVENVDNVDNKKVEHIFCATCLVYHKVGGMAEEKTFYLDRQGGGVLQLAP